MATITFYKDYRLDTSSVKTAQGVVGIYFIFLSSLNIPYPFGKSRLIYIGLSEAAQNSIGRRLAAHLTGLSGNEGIKNYAMTHETRFTYHPLQILQSLGTQDLFELEAFFLTRFLMEYGCYPICNNQSGVAVAVPMLAADARVDWRYFSEDRTT